MGDVRADTFAEEWQRMMEKDLNNNMLMDTPMGKTVFAFGAGYVMLRLRDAKRSKKEWDKLYDEIYDFTAAYMAESA